MPRAFRRPAVGLAESLFDRGQGLPPERVRWMLDDLADFLGHAGHKTELFFLITLFLIEYLPPLFGRFSRMSRLPLPARVAYLERLDRSRLAALIALPKAMLGLIWYEHPESLLETGYDHQPLLPAPRKIER
ncbi:MAG: hypothetical protein IT384_33275 [Deltaproteobacteria bacterium]|nr:hypothetical protein [Deltaproteobacteria bacterium]